MGAWAVLGLSFIVTSAVVGTAFETRNARRASHGVWLARLYFVAVVVSGALRMIPVFAAVAFADAPNKSALLARGIHNDLRPVLITGVVSWLVLLFVSGFVRASVGPAKS